MNKTEMWLLSESCLDMDTPVCTFTNKDKAREVKKELEDYTNKAPIREWYRRHPIHKYIQFDEVVPVLQSTYFIQRINLIT